MDFTSLFYCSLWFAVNFVVSYACVMHIGLAIDIGFFSDIGKTFKVDIGTPLF